VNETTAKGPMAAPSVDAKPPSILQNPQFSLEKKAELLWKHYAQNIDMLKFWFDSAIKLNTFYYAVTGAILSFYFAHRSPQTRLLPLLPGLLVGALAAFSAWGGAKTETMRTDLKSAAEALGLLTWPEIHALKYFLWISAAVGGIISVGCILLVLLA
jgi:hypothetical protein